MAQTSYNPTFCAALLEWRVLVIVKDRLASLAYAFSIEMGQKCLLKIFQFRGFKLRFFKLIFSFYQSFNNSIESRYNC